MANANKIKGFSPHSYLNGSPWNGQARLYAIPVSDTTASYAIGDPVMSAGGCDANGICYIKKVPAANASNFAALGVIVGIRVADPGVSLVGTSLMLENLFLAAGTRTNVRYAYVVDDPDVLFEISGGTTATNLTLAKGRYNAGIGSWYSGADQTYAIDQSSYLAPSAPLSNVIVSSATVNTTATLPLQIIGLAQRDDNAAGAYSSLLVRFNLHEFGFAVIGGTNFTGL